MCIRVCLLWKNIHYREILLIPDIWSSVRESVLCKYWKKCSILNLTQRQSLFWPWSSQSKFISLNCAFINAKSQEKKPGLNPLMPCAIWKNLLVYTLSSLGQSLSLQWFQTVYKTIETMLEYSKCLTILTVPVDSVLVHVIAKCVQMLQWYIPCKCI